MRLKVEIVNGVAKVTDEDTGASLDWVHTIDMVTDPAGAPVLYLGTYAFAAQVLAGNPAPTPVPPARTPGS